MAKDCVRFIAVAPYHDVQFGAAAANKLTGANELCAFSFGPLTLFAVASDMDTVYADLVAHGSVRSLDGQQSGISG